MIRVGRRIYNRDGSFTDPEFNNFLNIPVVMKSHSSYSSLSPYYLKDEKGRIMENYFQFSKVFENVPASIQTFSRYSSQVIWEHPAEKHIIYDVNGNMQLTNEWWNWNLAHSDKNPGLR